MPTPPAPRAIRHSAPTGGVGMPSVRGIIEPRIENPLPPLTSRRRPRILPLMVDWPLLLAYVAIAAVLPFLIIAFYAWVLELVKFSPFPR